MVTFIVSKVTKNVNHARPVPKPKMAVHPGFGAFWYSWYSWYPFWYFWYS
jgi:hypothetical protein